MKNLADIMKTLAEHKEELQQRYKVKEIGVFGSVVRGEQQRTSDIDILVEFEEGASLGLLKFINLENYLSELLGVKVDLVMKSALKPRIGKHVVKETVYL
ncbi:MAG: nucleotidyltransferase family protein [archaeon]|nr:nucleotidyltransferase family protein [archaeon]